MLDPLFTSPSQQFRVSEPRYVTVIVLVSEVAVPCSS